MISFSRSIVLEDNRRQRKQENLPPLTSPDSRIKIVEVVTSSISSYGSRSYMKWVSTNTDRMEGEILSRPVGLDFHTEAGFIFLVFSLFQILQKIFGQCISIIVYVPVGVVYFLRTSFHQSRVFHSYINFFQSRFFPQLSLFFSLTLKDVRCAFISKTSNWTLATSTLERKL